MSAAPRTLVITPTYNERENLAPFAAAVLAALPHAHLLIVDDASPDGTGALAEALARREPRLRVLHRPAKAGLGRAYLAGFRQALAAGYARVIQMDADFSHDPKELPLARFDTTISMIIGGIITGAVMMYRAFLVLDSMFPRWM